MTGPPKFCGDVKRVDRHRSPPYLLAPGLVVLAVVGPAQRDREFIAGFASHGAGLGEAEVMRVRGCTRTDQTGLGCHKPQVLLVALATGFAKGKYTLVNF